jgi:hypothetical protein
MHDHVSLNPVGPIGLCSLLVAKAYGAASICITGKHQHTVSISNNVSVFLYVESGPGSPAGRGDESPVSTNVLCCEFCCLGDNSPHDEHQSSGPRPVKLCSDQYIFQFLFRCIYIYIYI